MQTTADGSDLRPHHHGGKGNKFYLNGANMERVRGEYGAVVCWLTE